MIDEARRLYALPPAEFIAERNRTVKELKAGGRADDAAFVAGLRRPKLAEHTLNRVAHDDGALVAHAVSAAEVAATAQSAAIGGAKTSLREATAELRDAARALVDAAVRGLNESGASGEGQRDEIGELLRSLLAGDGSSQLSNGVVGYEGVVANEDLFAGAPDPPDSVQLDTLPERSPAKKSPAQRSQAQKPPARVGREGAISSDDQDASGTQGAGARRGNLARPAPRPAGGTCPSAAAARETRSAVDDAERQLAIASRELAKAQRAVDAAQASLDKAQATADAAAAALDAYSAEVDASSRR